MCHPLREYRSGIAYDSCQITVSKPAYHTSPVLLRSKNRARQGFSPTLYSRLGQANAGKGVRQQHSTQPHWPTRCFSERAMCACRIAARQSVKPLILMHCMQVRTSGFGLLNSIGRLSSIGTTFAAGALLDVALWAPLVLAAILLAVGSVAMMLLPESAGGEPDHQCAGPCECWFAIASRQPEYSHSCGHTTLHLRWPSIV